MAEMNQLERRKFISSLLSTLTGQLPQLWPQDSHFLTVARLGQSSTRKGWERWPILPLHQVTGKSQQPLSCHRQEYVAHWSETWECAKEKYAFFRCWAELPSLFMHQPRSKESQLTTAFGQFRFPEECGSKYINMPAVPALVHSYKTQLGMAL